MNLPEFDYNDFDEVDLPEMFEYTDDQEVDEEFVDNDQEDWDYDYFLEDDGTIREIDFREITLEKSK